MVVYQSSLYGGHNVIGVHCMGVIMSLGFTVWGHNVIRVHCMGFVKSLCGGFIGFSVCGVEWLYIRVHCMGS